jgi:hypothetical protein
MMEHPDRMMIQLYGLIALKKATNSGASATHQSASARTDVANVEGIQAILAAMERFPSDKNFIRNGFAALRTIIFGHESNAELLVTKIGAIPFLLEKMAEFKHDQDIMLCACTLLRNASRFEQLREAIVNADALLALGSAITNHKDNPNIQAATREAIKLLV